MTPPDEAYWTQKLEERRTKSADTVQTWSYPLAGSGHLVSGTFGEWRGHKTEKEPTGHVHEGLDLSTADNADIAVKASRGGVISFSNSIPNMGSYLVVDHGDGWFSRYLHLDPAFFSVSNGQAVARGDKLATRLYKREHWDVHLHFEVRKGPNTSPVGKPLSRHRAGPTSNRWSLSRAGRNRPASPGRIRSDAPASLDETVCQRSASDQ